MHGDCRKIERAEPVQVQSAGGLREPGRGALGQQHPLILSRPTLLVGASQMWATLNEMRVVGGAWLAEPWVQCPAGILIISRQV